MNAYEKAVELELTGTSQEIVDQLVATGLTNKPVSRAELIHVLNMRDMLTKIVDNNSDEKWIGSVLVMQDAIFAGGTEEQKYGIRKWLSHITNPTNMLWDTTHIAFAAPFWQMHKTFADLPTMPSSDDFAAIAELGGGWLFADLTVEQYEEQRMAAESLAQRQAIIDACINPISSAHAAAAAKLNNAKASLGPEHTDGLTLEELQARCVAIAASATGEV